MNNALKTSTRNDWETPADLWMEMWKYFDFTLDAAADFRNHLLPDWIDETTNALDPDTRWNGRVYCNPPYGRNVGVWLEKGLEEWGNGSAELVCFLLPARTDTKWFHKYAHNGSVLFLKGRLNFTLGKKEKHPAPFPSMLLIYGNLPIARGFKFMCGSWDWRQNRVQMAADLPSLVVHPSVGA